VALVQKSAFRTCRRNDVDFCTAAPAPAPLLPCAVMPPVAMAASE